MLSHGDISWIAGVQRPVVPLWNKCPGIFPNNPPVCLSVCGKALISRVNGKHLSDCLFVGLNGYLLLIIVFIKRGGGVEVQSPLMWAGERRYRWIDEGGEGQEQEQQVFVKLKDFWMNITAQRNDTADLKPLNQTQNFKQEFMVRLRNVDKEKHYHWFWVIFVAPGESIFFLFFFFF